MGQLLSVAMLVIGLVLKFVFLPRYAGRAAAGGRGKK